MTIKDLKEKFEKLKCTISKLKHDFPELNTGYNIYDGSCVSIRETDRQ